MVRGETLLEPPTLKEQRDQHSVREARGTGFAWADQEGAACERVWE